MQNKILVPVLDFEDKYLVSEDGDIISIPRIDASGSSRKERVLKLTTTRDGYLRANFFSNGQSSRHLVHRIVFSSFVHKIPNGMEINHLDGNRKNNHFSNLECVSHADNVKHSVNVLKTNYVTYGNARMTEQILNTIFELKQRGLFHRQIAEIVNFSESQVDNVISGKCWSSKSIRSHP